MKYKYENKSLDDLKITNQRLQITKMTLFILTIINWLMVTITVITYFS